MSLSAIPKYLYRDCVFETTNLISDGGFVVLQGTTYWTDLFVRHFLFQSEPEHSIDSDDLLFFVRKKHVKGTSRQMPKYDVSVNFDNRRIRSKN